MEKKGGEKETKGKETEKKESIIIYSGGTGANRKESKGVKNCFRSLPKLIFLKSAEEAQKITRLVERPQDI